VTRRGLSGTGTVTGARQLRVRLPPADSEACSESSGWAAGPNPGGPDITIRVARIRSGQVRFITRPKSSEVHESHKAA
jgi:hypothetical protein